jgi:hypothetical protein
VGGHVIRPIPFETWRALTIGQDGTPRRQLGVFSAATGHEREYAKRFFRREFNAGTLRLVRDDIDTLEKKTP